MLPRRTSRVVLWGLQASAAAMWWAGCAPRRPEPGAEHAITDSTGEAVEFRLEAAPLDEPAGVERLTLVEATRLAVRTDPSLQAALARVRRATAEADAARLLPNPVLTVVVRWGGGPAQIEASLAEDLLRLVQTPRRASAADGRLREAAAEAVTKALDIVHDVQAQYIAVQAGSQRIAHLQRQAELIRSALEFTRRRAAVGEASRSDVAALEADAAAVEVEAAKEAVQVATSRLRLARLIGEPSGAAAWMLDAWSVPELDPGPEAPWIAAALEHRPEVQSARWRLASLGDEAAMARGAAWESLSAGVDAQRDDDWVMGPSVSTPLPLFDTGRARRRAAEADVVEARHRLLLADRLVVEDVRTAQRALSESLVNVRRVREKLIPAEWEQLRLAEAAHRVGEVDVAAVILAERSLLAAQTSAVGIEETAALSRVRLHRAVGGAVVAGSVLPDERPAHNGSPVSTGKGD